MNDAIKGARGGTHLIAVAKINGPHGKRKGCEFVRRIGRKGPGLDFPTRFVDKKRGCLADVAAPGNQNSRHPLRAGSRNFDLGEGIALHRAHLFEPNQFE